LSFAYAGPDRIWQNTWRDADKLPTMIRLTVRDAATERVLSISTVTPVHIQVPSDCLQPDGDCDNKAAAPSNAPQGNQAGSPGQGRTL
jgi:general secretion pathway protein J